MRKKNKIIKQKNSHYLLFIPVITVCFVILMLFSFKYRYLDIFVPGAWHGRIGLDFFSVPRSFINLLNHMNIYDTWYLHYSPIKYAPYASWYPYHPALSVLLGSWLSRFEAWEAYIIFVTVSIAILCYCAYLISKTIGNISAVLKRLTPYLLLCSFPTYLMLWNAQMHVFTVLSVTMVMMSLMRIYLGDDKQEKSFKILLFIGLLASLLSKPVVLLLLPVLLFTKETRRTTISCLTVYALISVLFIATPALNPVYKSPYQWFWYPSFDNTIHWLNIFNQSSKVELHNIELFSLPAFITDLLGREINSFIYKIPLIMVFVLSFAVFKIKSNKNRALMALLVVIISIYCYYLSYTMVWEYHYVTLLPTIPIMYILFKNETHESIKKLLKYSLFISVSFYLPTLAFLFKSDPERYISIYRLTRVIPVLLIFSILSYVIISKFQIIQKESVIKVRNRQLHR